MQSLLRAGPSFRVKAKCVAAYIQKCNANKAATKVRTCIFSKNVFFLVSFLPIIRLYRGCLVCSFLFLHSFRTLNFQFSLGHSQLSFSVDLNFFQSESIFYFLPLLSSLFLRRNTVTCKLDFLMHIDIERKSCIVISHVCIWAYVTPRKSTCTPVLPN